MTKLALACALALVWLAPEGANACFNAVLLTGASAEREVKRIEGELSSGRHQKVIAWAEDHEVSGVALRRRLKLLVLTARVRLKARQKAIERNGLGSLTFDLEALHKEAADDPLIQARLAEALALDPAMLDEAKTLIEDLVTRDLMPDPEAWATSAFVQRSLGDVEGSQQALERCRQIAGRRKHACFQPLR